MTSDKKPEGPRERVESFASRRRQELGDFVSIKQLTDGYVRVKFQNATYLTPIE